MNAASPTRSWYAQKLPLSRYQVTCKHKDGVEEDCGTSGPDTTRDDLLTWILERAQPQEPLLINELFPRKEVLA